MFGPDGGRRPTEERGEQDLGVGLVGVAVKCGPGDAQRLGEPAMRPVVARKLALRGRRRAGHRISSRTTMWPPTTADGAPNSLLFGLVSPGRWVSVFRRMLGRTR